MNTATKRTCSKAMLALVLGLFLTACPAEIDDDSPVILRVNDIPITLADFEKQLEFELTFASLVSPGEEKNPDQFTLDEIKARVINESLIPHAAVHHAYRDKIPGLVEEAQAIRDRIAEDRSNFATLSAEHSTTSVAASGGRTGFFGRGSTLPYPLPATAYSLEPGSVSEPFISLVGCYLVYVKNIEKGTTDALDRLDASVILLAFEDDPLFLQKTLPGLIEGAEVEIVDPDMSAYVRKRK